MLKWLAGAALVLAAAFCVGFFDKVDTTYVEHRVAPGETLNGIAAQYYGLNTRGYIPPDDYAMMVRVKNNKLHNLDRMLQVGDLVMVPVYTKK